MRDNPQEFAPLAEALESIRSMRIVPFDVPGHKRGRGNKPLTDFLGKQCLSVDINSMKVADNLCHPTSVIKEAQVLAAAAFGAAQAMFMVGGTTSSVQAMLMYALSEGDKIIMPRNVHRSAINALILTGAEPVYVDPKTNRELGIALGMTLEDVREAIIKHPEAKAVLVNNPTYYGVCTDLRGIVEAAHNAGMLVMADEAHGTHFYFHDRLPVSAMAAGADMAAVSMHKSGGSLTQSSLLLLGSRINADYMRQVINLTQTTSGSYLLMSGLDLSRKMLALNGEEIFGKVIDMAEYAREEINRIGGLYAFSSELKDGGAFFDFDLTKLAVNTYNTGFAGIEVYDKLRDDYGIQIEFGDVSNILAYLSMGDNYKHLERLIGALYIIVSETQGCAAASAMKQEYIPPVVICPPREAFYARKKQVSLDAAIGSPCAEFVMCYPPGIPVLAPGELITPQIVDYLKYVKSKGYLVTGMEDIGLNSLNIITGGQQ